MPITAFTFIVGWLAIAGIPPFSGFWSKDEVLLAAWNENKIAWAMLLIAAIMTAFYMSRLVFITFFGEKKWGIAEHGETEGDEEQAETDSETDTEDGDKHEVTPHESPIVMWLPLVILSGLAAVAGLLNLPFSYDTKHLEHWLEPILFGNEVHVTASSQTKWILAIIAIVGATTGVLAAAFVYLKNRSLARQIEHSVLEEAWRFDSTVSNFMGGPGRKGFEAVTLFDQKIIDGAVNGVGKVTQRISTRMRSLQTGLIRSYALGMFIGAVAIIAYFVSRMGF